MVLMGEPGQPTRRMAFTMDLVLVVPKRLDDQGRKNFGPGKVLDNSSPRAAAAIEPRARAVIEIAYLPLNAFSRYPWPLGLPAQKLGYSVVQWSKVTFLLELPASRRL